MAEFLTYALLGIACFVAGYLLGTYQALDRYLSEKEKEKLKEGDEED